MERLEKKLQYAFRNTALLEQALCHSSYANEHYADRLKCNERLEFLGDSVLGIVTAEWLYRKYPNLPEGDLTRIRASLVCEESLNDMAKKLGLGSYLKLGRGEDTNAGRKKASILSDAMEAVIAAVYLDSGLDSAAALIRRCLLDSVPEISAEEARLDYKTELQERVQRHSDWTMSYHVLDEQGPDHAKVFTAEVRINGERHGIGTGHSKKEAERSAAHAALKEWKQKYPDEPA